MARDWNSSTPSLIRHHHLRIECAIFGRELIASLQMQKGVLARQALEVEGDPHTEARL